MNNAENRQADFVFERETLIDALVAMGPVVTDYHYEYKATDVSDAELVRGQATQVSVFTRNENGTVVETPVDFIREDGQPSDPHEVEVWNAWSIYEAFWDCYEMGTLEAPKFTGFCVVKCRRDSKTNKFNQFVGKPSKKYASADLVRAKTGVIKELPARRDPWNNIWMKPEVVVGEIRPAF